jgi:hypothetical protein
MFNKIKEFFNSKQPMANTSFVPINKDDKAAAITALMNYKKQNPVKFELKKAELYKKFGIEVEEEAKLEPVKDATDIELETLKAKATKTK